jgi:hypothetical protein
MSARDEGTNDVESFARPRRVRLGSEIVGEVSADAVGRRHAELVTHLVVQEGRVWVSNQLPRLKRRKALDRVLDRVEHCTFLIVNGVSSSRPSEKTIILPSCLGSMPRARYASRARLALFKGGRPCQLCVSSEAKRLVRRRGLTTRSDHQSLASVLSMLELGQR